MSARVSLMGLISTGRSNVLGNDTSLSIVKSAACKSSVYKVFDGIQKSNLTFGVRCGQQLV